MKRIGEYYCVWIHMKILLVGYIKLKTDYTVVKAVKTGFVQNYFNRRKETLV